MACERGLRAQARPLQTSGRQDRSCTRNCFAICNFVPNPAKLAAIPAGGAFFPGHGLDVGAVQRGCRPEAVEHDADGAAIAARANDDPFPAGEIGASHRSECAHPDAGLWKRPRPFFGRLWWRSRRTGNHCGAHLFGRRRQTFGAECLSFQKVGRYTRPDRKQRVSMVPLDRIRLSIRPALRARHFVSQNPSKVLRSRSTSLM